MRISNYYRRPSGAPSPDAVRVDMGPVTVWFSYTTPIAFHVSGGQRVVRENDWGPTTGRHLNEIDRGDRKSRVPGEEFTRLFNEQVMRFFYPRDLDANCPAPVVADWLQDRELYEAARIVRETSKEK